MKHACLASAMLVTVMVGVFNGVVFAESAEVFGVHNWEWGVNVDVMNFKAGWITEANLAHESPNVNGRYAPMVGEGFTIIQRLDWTWDDTIPPNPTDYDTFAQNCAWNWAYQIKPYCRHYLIGNEMELQGYGPSEYIPCFQEVRDAIQYVQPDAIVIIGHFTNEGNLRAVMQTLGPDGYDGICDHTGSSVSTGKLAMLDEENARSGVGMYISEWGWVAGTNPNPAGVMTQFCQDVLNWNANNTRQVYAATWYRYPCWDPVFSLQCSEPDNLGFESMTANCDAVSSLADNQVVMSNVRVQVSETQKALVVRWATDQLAKSMLWYWNPLANSRNGEFMPLDSTLVTAHQMTMDNAIHVKPQTEYRMICRSPVDDAGNGNAGPFFVTTGPWTVDVINVTPTAATILWDTIFEGTTRVEYGPTTDYGEEYLDPTPTRQHVVHLQNLTPMTTYHFRVWTEGEGYAPHHSVDHILDTTIPAGPFISVSPAAIEVSTQPGIPLPNDSFTITNTADDSFNYTITTDCTWLTPVPATGSVTNEEDTITLVYDTTALPVGDYSCVVTVSSNEAVNSPVYAPFVTLHVATVGADFDHDGDVDLDDFGHLQSCFSGSGIPQADPLCQDADLNGDEDVDQADFALLSGCMTGANILASPECMP